MEKISNRYTVYISRHTKTDLDYLRKHGVNISKFFRNVIDRKAQKLLRDNGDLK